MTPTPEAGKPLSAQEADALCPHNPMEEGGPWPTIDLPCLNAALRDAYAKGREEGIEAAAEMARTWGHAPPNPAGRRAALAKAILALREE